MTAFFKFVAALPKLLGLVLELWRAWQQIKMDQKTAKETKVINDDKASTIDMEASIGNSSPGKPSGIGELRRKE
jgi:hypothetical protein